MNIHKRTQNGLHEHIWKRAPLYMCVFCSFGSLSDCWWWRTSPKQQQQQLFSIAFHSVFVSSCVCEPSPHLPIKIRVPRQFQLNPPPDLFKQAATLQQPSNKSRELHAVSPHFVSRANRRRISHRKYKFSYPFFKKYIWHWRGSRAITEVDNCTFFLTLINSMGGVWNIFIVSSLLSTPFFYLLMTVVLTISLFHKNVSFKIFLLSCNRNLW